MVQELVSLTDTFTEPQLQATEHFCSVSDLDYSNVEGGRISCKVCPRYYTLHPLTDGNGAIWRVHPFIPGLKPNGGPYPWTNYVRPPELVAQDEREREERILRKRKRELEEKKIRDEENAMWRAFEERPFRRWRFRGQIAPPQLFRRWVPRWMRE